MRTAMVVGMSGHTGKKLIEKLLLSRTYRRVITLSRREDRKLKNIHLIKHIVDFGNLEPHREVFESCDEVFCLLGKDYVNAKVQTEIEQLVYNYPIEVARMAKAVGIKRFLLLNPTIEKLNSSDPEMRLRKQLEEEILQMGFEDFHVVRIGKIQKPKHWITLRRKWLNFVKFTRKMMGKSPDGFHSIPANILADEIFQWANSQPDLLKEH
ncbi:MAG: NAD-dependent epimerase/dehydratase family protein [Bacteroidia bacterium]